jgi:L-aspartate oxidase
MGEVPYPPVPEPAAQTPVEADVAVVGAGAAGLYTALVAAELGARVQLVSRSPLPQSASYWAQGGLAAALDPGDSPALHLEDTLAAGRGATRRSAARLLSADAPERVAELELLGIDFDREADGRLMLSLEGGHTRRRVVHAGGSATGRHLTLALAQLVQSDERIGARARTTALSLWVSDGRCTGVVTDAGPIRAAATVLSTGGAAALWLRHTNPPGAIGAGLLLAANAGAALADLEFMQFHPTALVSPGDLDGFLITEAVRGEGALLVNGAGRRFVDELAPRDEVARAIHEQLRASREEAVFLDMREVPAERFPNIVEALARVELDPRRDLIPVAPAAHYMIGGVATDLDARSSLPGLFAVGECACTGLHGANRLASNSLSECFVFGRRAALAAASEPAADRVPSAPPPAGRQAPPPSQATRAGLSRDAGIVREAAGLERLTADPHPLARLIGRAALMRRESRGCHLRFDVPGADRELDERHLVVTKPDEERWERWS